MNPVVTQLAAAYTKALLANPKDVVYANMERAVAHCPIVKASTKLLDALEIILGAGYIDDAYGTVLHYAREAIKEARGAS